MPHTTDDVRAAKQQLEGNIIMLLEDFQEKYGFKEVDLNLVPIRFIGEKTMYDVQISVKI